jgi:hypothetical protein
LIGRRGDFISSSMPRKSSPPPDDPAQSKRFIEMAREIGADESEEGRKAFERAFMNVARPTKQDAPPKRGSRRS